MPIVFFINQNHFGGKGRDESFIEDVGKIDNRKECNPILFESLKYTHSTLNSIEIYSFDFRQY
jgi:hypothetical protein